MSFLFGTFVVVFFVIKLKTMRSCNLWVAGLLTVKRVWGSARVLNHEICGTPHKQLPQIVDGYVRPPKDSSLRSLFFQQQHVSNEQTPTPNIFQHGIVRRRRRRRRRRGDDDGNGGDDDDDGNRVSSSSYTASKPQKPV